MDSTYLTPEQVGVMQKAASNLRDALLIRLLFHLGCRISELLPLTVGQVDTENSTVTLKLLKQRLRVYCPKCKTRLGRQSKFCQVCGEAVKEAVQEATEKTEQRILPLDKPTMRILQHFIADAKLKPDARIFPFLAHHAWFIVTTAARMAGIKDMVNPESGRRRHPSPHRLRDAFATMVVLRDDSPDSMRVLQERMGHKNVATTWKYRKVAGKEQKEWLDNIFAEDDDIK